MAGASRKGEVSKTAAAAAKKPAAAAGPKAAPRAAKPKPGAAAPPPPPPDPDIDAAASGKGPVLPGESETAASDAAAAAALRGESDPEPTTQSGPEPEADLESEDVLSGAEVPVYNPLPIPQTHQHSGIFYTVRARGVDLWPSAAVALACGLDNEGGVLAHTGIRRLFGPEARFQAHADIAGVTLPEYVEQRNGEITAQADGVGAGWAQKNGLQDDTEDAE